MTPEEIASLREGLIVGLKDEINLFVKESVVEQVKSKDKEVSSLHREIRDDIKVLKDLVSGHDEVIQELRQLYKTSGYIKRFILWILIFVPSVAGFFGGLKYLYDLIIKHNV